MSADALLANTIAANAGSTTEDFKLAMFLMVEPTQSYSYYAIILSVLITSVNQIPMNAHVGEFDLHIAIICMLTTMVSLFRLLLKPCLIGTSGLPCLCFTNKFGKGCK